MNFTELVKIRQSTRKYASTAVEIDLINKCIEAARLAPSACNAQPWKFIIINDFTLKNKVAEHISDVLMNKFVYDAAVLVTIVIEKPTITSWIGEKVKNREFPLIDIGIAAEHFCLQATELGIGTCMIGWFNEKPIKKLLSIPLNKRIGLIISMGYSTPDYPVRLKIRKPIDVMSSFNKY